MNKSPLRINAKAPYALNFEVVIYFAIAYAQRPRIYAGMELEFLSAEPLPNL